MEGTRRSDIVTPSGLAQRVTTEYFLEHILPPLPSELTSTGILTSIRHYGKKSQRLLTQRGRWRGFSTTPASDARDKHAIFVHFAAIVEAIFKAGRDRGFVLNAKFVQHLNHEDKELDSTQLPDGCITSMDGDGKTWEDVAVVGWYSKFGDHASLVSPGVHT